MPERSLCSSPGQPGGPRHGRLPPGDGTKPRSAMLPALAEPSPPRPIPANSGRCEPAGRGSGRAGLGPGPCACGAAGQPHQPVVARFLLKPGCKYEQAVKAFEPCDGIKEENPEAPVAGRALVAEGKAAGPKRRTFVFVNNRLEGNAISTTAAMLDWEPYTCRAVRPARGS
jgi:hypothetical protein